MLKEEENEKRNRESTLFKEIENRAVKAKKDLVMVKHIAHNLKSALDKKICFNNSLSPITKGKLCSRSHPMLNDEFDFLASKMPECNQLSNNVITFPGEDQVLGVGTYGKVKKAFFTKLDVPVAVKIGRIGQFSAIFEAKIMSRLSGHKCFPHVFGVLDNMLVMELVRFPAVNENETLSVKRRCMRNLSLFKNGFIYAGHWVTLCDTCIDV